MIFEMHCGDNFSGITRSYFTHNTKTNEEFREDLKNIINKRKISLSVYLDIEQKLIEVGYQNQEFHNNDIEYLF